MPEIEHHRGIGANFGVSIVVYPGAVEHAQTMATGQDSKNRLENGCDRLFHGFPSLVGSANTVLDCLAAHLCKARVIPRQPLSERFCLRF
jgi:hypothetical protein